MLIDSYSADVIDIPSAKNDIQQASFRTHQVPYRSKSSSPSELPTFAEFHTTQRCWDLRPVTMLDEAVKSLQEYAKMSATPPSSYNIFSLATGPIRLIIEEWQMYSLIMGRYVKSYQYSTKNIQVRLSKFESEDILELYRWRRRSQRSLHKMHVLKWFIESSSKLTEGNCEKPLSEAEALLKDITYIMDQIKQNGQMLESMIPIMTSIVQLMDSRRSMIETIFVKRLTYIALVFLPLSFVATLFSMSEPFSVAGSGFWIYIVTAIPLLLFVLAASTLHNPVVRATLVSLCRGKMNCKI